jgi:hypothetical protein
MERCSSETIRTDRSERAGRTLVRCLGAHNPSPIDVRSPRFVDISVHRRERAEAGRRRWWAPPPPCSPLRRGHVAAACPRAAQDRASGPRRSPAHPRQPGSALEPSARPPAGPSTRSPPLGGRHRSPGFPERLGCVVVAPTDRSGGGPHHPASGPGASRPRAARDRRPVRLQAAPYCSCQRPGRTPWPCQGARVPGSPDVASGSEAGGPEVARRLAAHASAEPRASSPGSPPRHHPRPPNVPPRRRGPPGSGSDASREHRSVLPVPSSSVGIGSDESLER